MRLNRVWLVSWFCCRLLCAQNAPPAPASAGGVVLNSLTGEPILHAHVLLQTMGQNMGYSMSSAGPRIMFNGDPDSDSKNYGALTNGEGRFSIASLPPGKYYVSVERVGFVASTEMPSDANTLVLGAGDRKDDFKMKLTPAGAIAGRILDADGEPVSNASVTVMGAHGIQQDTSDEQGRYRIGGLTSGRYRTVAAPPLQSFMPSIGVEIRTDGSRQIHLASTYYPDAVARSGARVIEVGPGAQVSGMDIRLAATPNVLVSGKVTGMPAGKAQVSIEASRQDEEFGWFGMRPQTSMKADGTFTLGNLDPGKYVLTGVAEGQHGLQSTPVEIEVGGTNIEHVELRMIAPFEVTGTIHFLDDQTNAVPKAPGADKAPPPAVRMLFLQPMGGRMQFEGNNVQVGADDSFTLEKVPPGQYHVAISWGPGYVRSVRAGMTETDGDVLDVRNGAPGPVVISVSSLTCEISGTVSDANGPVANGRVILAPESGSGMFSRTASTKSDGTYRFSGLPPGKFKLAAVDNSISFNMMQNSGMLDDYEDVAESIDLSPGDKITKDLKRK